MDDQQSVDACIVVASVPRSENMRKRKKAGFLRCGELSRADLALLVIWLRKTESTMCDRTILCNVITRRRHLAFPRRPFSHGVLLVATHSSNHHRIAIPSKQSQLDGLFACSNDRFHDNMQASCRLDKGCRSSTRKVQRGLQVVLPCAMHYY